MDIVIGVILPCIAVVVFVGGMIYRIYVWKKLPVPTMTLFPSPQGSKGQIMELAREILLFKALFKGDKSLWAMSWIFHLMLALIFLGHFRVISGLPDHIFLALGMSSQDIGNMSHVAGGAAGVVILLSLLFLLGRRIFTQRVREISTSGDYVALILVLAILLTGDAMRFFAHIDLGDTREYFKGLVTFSSIKLPDNGWFIAHYILGLLLFMYIPFSKILHFGGIFFSKAVLMKQ